MRVWERIDKEVRKGRCTEEGCKGVKGTEKGTEFRINKREEKRGENVSKTFRALEEKSFRSVERFMGQLRLPFFLEKELSYEVIMFNSENHTFLCSFIPIFPLFVHYSKNLSICVFVHIEVFACTFFFFS